MAQKKKLQIFVSSTYIDLKEGRQAAVEAILTAGHIPAGMELFAAGDESQMNVIKRWIDESDVYLLILGGCYGSIDPKSQRSYTQLEYEYAVEQGKPLFAIVITEEYLEEKLKKHGSIMIEREYPQKLKDFRALVLSKIVRFWSDTRDIKLAILETLAEFSHRDNLIGWVPGSEVINSGALAEELARLAKENAALREQMKGLSPASTTYSGLDFKEMYSLLTRTRLKEELDTIDRYRLEEVAEIFGDPEPRLIHIFWVISKRLQTRELMNIHNEVFNILGTLHGFDLVDKEDTSPGFSGVYWLSEAGKQFLTRLRVERNTERAEEFILERP